jgi:hypothetical protein
LITDNDGIIFVNNHGNSCSSVIVREFFLLIDEDGEGVWVGDNEGEGVKVGLTTEEGASRDESEYKASAGVFGLVNDQEFPVVLQNFPQSVDMGFFGIGEIFHHLMGFSDKGITKVRRGMKSWIARQLS